MVMVGWPLPRSDEARAVAEEQIRHVVRAVILVDDGTHGIVAHSTGAEQVHTARVRSSRLRDPALGAIGESSVKRACPSSERTLKMFALSWVFRGRAQMSARIAVQNSLRSEFE